MPRIDPKWIWVQCDSCNKWRRLPYGIKISKKDKWFCYMNQDPAHK